MQRRRIKNKLGSIFPSTKGKAHGFGLPRIDEVEKMEDTWKETVNVVRLQRNFYFPNNHSSPKWYDLSPKNLLGEFFCYAMEKKEGLAMTEKRSTVNNLRFMIQTAYDAAPSVL